MRTLLERGWVRIVGHRDVPGHPALYATTKNFLDYFNLRNLDELPSLAEIKDLTQANEELDMEDDLIELPSLELDVEEEAEVAGMDDADLDAVSDQVDTIQQNIKNLLAADEEALAAELGEGDSEALEIKQQSEPEVVEPGELDVQSDTQSSTQSDIQPDSDIDDEPEIKITPYDDRS